MTGSIQQITVISASTFLLNYDNNSNRRFKTRSKTDKPGAGAPNRDLSPSLASQQTARRDAAMDITTNNLHTLRSLTREISASAGGTAKTLTAAVAPSLSRPDSQSLSPILLTASNIAVPYGAEPVGSRGLQSWGFFSSFFFLLIFFFFKPSSGSSPDPTASPPPRLPQ